MDYDHVMARIGEVIDGAGVAVFVIGAVLLVAGDIVRTVAAQPTLTSVAILATIVLIRTFLSFSLEVELTGRWPWEQDTALIPPANQAVPSP